MMQGPLHLQSLEKRNESRFTSTSKPSLRQIITQHRKLIDCDQEAGREMEYTAPPKLLSSHSGRVILLNGFPGVGKFSIGRSLFGMFDPKHARFIDNHLLIDPVQAIIPGRGADHKVLRRTFRQVAFDALTTIEDASTTLIFTSCLSSSKEDQQVFEEYLAIASQRRVPLYLFNISCDRREHHSRLVTTERSTGSKTKLVSPEILDDMLDEHQLVKIAQNETTFPEFSARYMFELDSTYDSIEETASKIHRIVTQDLDLTSTETPDIDDNVPEDEQSHR